jgi:hypothetical protein
MQVRPTSCSRSESQRLLQCRCSKPRAVARSVRGVYPNARHVYLQQAFETHWKYAGGTR